MTKKSRLLVQLNLALVLVHANPATARTAERLPSWNDGKTKRSIPAFVEKVTTSDSARFSGNVSWWTCVPEMSFSSPWFLNRGVRRQ
jgi:hypothetical protein